MIISFEILNPFEYSKKAYFKILGRNDIHDIRIRIEEGIAYFRCSDCSCEFGSHWGQTKENLKNGKICSHLQEALNFLEHEAWIGERINIDITNNGKN